MRKLPDQWVEDRKRLTGDREVTGVPEEEDVETADVEERLEEDPERVPNRRDVPPAPENSREARTEDE